MAIRDGNGRTSVALAEGPEELRSVPGSGAAEIRDWRSLYERERERAEAAEARAEELRWAEVRALQRGRVEVAMGGVGMVLVPSDREDVDSPACLPELVPKLPVGLAPAMERASGGHARIYVGEDGPVTLDGGTPGTLSS